MGLPPLGTLVRHLRRLTGASAGPDCSDAELLRLYALRRDDDAFAALVQRHGRLVWGVCRRVLRQDADAEDAFQATFLALARHAAAVRAGVAVPSWLYRVAFRVALKAGRARDRRQTCETEAVRPMHARPDDDDLSWRELRGVVEEELRRLPEKYQAPFLLCCLEGMTKAAAARQLGWKEGTVSGRLAEARKRLRYRLLRRGVAPSTALSAATLGHALAEAAPAPLVENTIRAVSQVAAVPAKVALLMEGVGNTMSVNKVKVVAVVLLLGGLLAGGTSLLSRPGPAARPSADLRAAEAPPEKRAEEPPPPEPPVPPVEDRLDEVLRRWHEATRKVEAAMCEITRTEKDTAFNKTVVFEGTFKYRKPSDWAIEMHKKGAPEQFERLVGTETALYQFVPSARVVRLFEKPSHPFGQLFRDTSDAHTSLFFGMAPTGARSRFDWKLVKEDQNYIYLDVRPRRKEDLASFQSARVVLHKDRFLPRQVWFHQSGSTELTWDVTKLDTNVRLTKDDIVPTIPDGWELMVVGSDDRTPKTEPPPPDPPGRPGSAERLDAVLRGWAAATEKLDSLSCELQGGPSDRTRVYHGSLKFLKPNLCVLDLHRKDAPNEPGERVVCDGKDVFRYRPGDKVVEQIDQSILQRMPPGTVWAFFFGTTPAEVRHQYDLKLVKEDQWYVYLEVRPRPADDGRGFVEARLVLLKENMLPRQFWCRMSGGNEVTWEITKTETDVGLKPADFKAAIPSGWRVERQPPPDPAKPR
jgi:TIGR03009 family protein